MPTHLSHTHLASTHSTNSQLIDWIYQNFTQRNNPFDYQTPHLLTADTQTGGRGQHGRQWQSPQGNVYLSLYIPYKPYEKSLPPLERSLVGGLTQPLDGRLSLCVGYQLAKIPIISELNHKRTSENLAKIGVKWVNDLGFYQKQTFNKLAGILIEPVTVENKLLGVVVGVGMNVFHTPDLSQLSQISQLPQTLPYQAVSIAELFNNLKPLSKQYFSPTFTKARLHPSLEKGGVGGGLNDLSPFYHQIQTAIIHAITQFNGFDDPLNVQQFIQDFTQVDVLKGKNLKITLPMTEIAPIIGQAIGIDSNGSLQILQNDGTITPIWTGTVQVLP